MRIIEQEIEETTLPEEETSQPKKSKEVVSERISPQKEMFLIAKEIHELGNKLMELASKL